MSTATKTAAAARSAHLAREPRERLIAALPGAQFSAELIPHPYIPGQLRGILRITADVEAALAAADKLQGIRERNTGVVIPCRNDSAWLGSTCEQFIKDRYKPDAQGLAESDKIVDATDAAARSIEFERPETLASVVGSSPNVGAYLMGSPLSMYRTQQTVEQGLISKIHFGMAVSAGFSAKDMRNRAIAAFALARTIQTMRPVELYGVCATEPSAPVTLVDNETGESDSVHTTIVISLSFGSAPFDATSASRAACSPFLTRAVLYGIAYLCAGDNQCGWLGFPSIPFARCVEANKQLDVVIDGGHLSDAAEITKNPNKWVERQLREWAAGRSTAYRVHTSGTIDNRW